VVLLLVALELHSGEDRIGGDLVEDEFGLFFDCAPGHDAAVEVAGEGGDGEAFVADLGLGTLPKVVDDDFVGANLG